MDSNLIVLTDQDGNSVRFELLDIVEYKEDEYAVLYPADGGDDEPVHILRIISENLDVNEAEFEGLDDDELILPRKKSSIFTFHTPVKCCSFFILIFPLSLFQSTVGNFTESDMSAKC